MHQAIPYSNGRAWPPLPSAASNAVPTATARGGSGLGMIRKLVAENPVTVVGRRGCCMILVMSRLLMGQGANPTVCEVGEGTDDAALMAELADMASSASATVARQQQLLPAVFIGGRLVGGVDRLMALHISGELVQILREAGAIWV